MRLLLGALLLAGCNFGSTGGADGGGGYGFGQPALQVTINGVQFGPAAPDATSYAELVTQRDGAGRVLQSTFTVAASASAVGAACNLVVQRFGSGATAIAALPYQLQVAGTNGTPDGTVAPIAGERVSVPQGTWQCTGSSCNGGTFNLSVLDASHAEGFLSGVFAHTGGVNDANVVCSFWLPMRTYQP